MSKMRQNYESGDALTWVQLHNFLPIFSMVVGVALAWGNLSGKDDVMTEKINRLENDVAVCFNRVESVQNQIKGQEVSLQSIWALPAVKGASTARGTITPTPTKQPTPTSGVKKTN